MCTVLYNSADACHLPATNSIEHILRLTREGRDSSDRARTESKAQTCCVKSKENKLFTWTNIYKPAKLKTIYTDSETSTAPGTWKRVLQRNYSKNITMHNWFGFENAVTRPNPNWTTVFMMSDKTTTILPSFQRVYLCNKLDACNKA